MFKTVKKFINLIRSLNREEKNLDALRDKLKGVTDEKEIEKIVSKSYSIGNRKSSETSDMSKVQKGNDNEERPIQKG